jgi:hypothetical protein
MSVKSAAKDTVKDEVKDGGAAPTTGAAPGAPQVVEPSEPLNIAQPAWYLQEPQYDGVREIIRQAYLQGAKDVHENYKPDSDPDFAEAASDYTTSVTRAFLDLFPSVPHVVKAPADEGDESLYEAGEALVKAIEDNREHPALKNWAPTQCPSEVVVDLLNVIDEAQFREMPLPELLAFSQAAQDVLAERARQVVDEGYSPATDDMYAEGVLGKAGASYLIYGSLPDQVRQVIALEGVGTRAVFMRRYWPWDRNVFKPKSRRQDLVRGVALGLAEIERLDRAAELSGTA